MSEARVTNILRLDQYVHNQLPELSRAQVARIIENGAVTVGDEPKLKPSYRVRQADRVVINFKPKKVPHQNLDLEIIYEDEDCIVINKPAGVLTHSKGDYNPEPTVATWLNSHAKNMTGERAGIVHRLDRATSGVMILAKTDESLKWLQKQFSERKVNKTYVAVVEGKPKNAQAIIDMPIERNPKRPQTFRVGSNGKAAVTAYKVISSGKKFNLLELKPTSGRTHQLRVHLSHIGNPILGDKLYGGSDSDRLYLHAKHLDLTLPNKTRETFSIPTPTEFKNII